MCLFKKKNKKAIAVTNNKFNMGDPVGYRPKFDLIIGFICDIKQDENGQILYDINVGGECPYVIKDIPEEKLHLR